MPVEFWPSLLRGKVQGESLHALKQASSQMDQAKRCGGFLLMGTSRSVMMRI
jgi:hypothetical protein